MDSDSEVDSEWEFELDAVDVDYQEDFKKYATIELGLNLESTDADLAWVAWEAFTRPVPEGWSEHTDTTGRVYFHNWVVRESTWSHPDDEMFKSLLGTIIGLRAERPFPSEARRSQVMQEHLANVYKVAERDLLDWSGPYTKEGGGEYFFNERLKESMWESPSERWERQLATRQAVLHRCLLIDWPHALAPLSKDLSTAQVRSLADTADTVARGLAQKDDDELSERSAKSQLTMKSCITARTARSDRSMRSARSGRSARSQTPRGKRPTETPIPSNVPTPLPPPSRMEELAPLPAILRSQSETLPRFGAAEEDSPCVRPRKDPTTDFADIEKVLPLDGRTTEEVDLEGGTTLASEKTTSVETTVLYSEKTTVVQADAEKNAAEERAVAEEEQKLAEERAAAEKAAAERKLAEERAVAEKTAAETEKKLAVEREIAEKVAVEEKKLAEDRAVAERATEEAEKTLAEDKVAMELYQKAKEQTEREIQDVQLDEPLKQLEEQAEANNMKGRARTKSTEFGSPPRKKTYSVDVIDMGSPAVAVPALDLRLKNALNAFLHNSNTSLDLEHFVNPEQRSRARIVVEQYPGLRCEIDDGRMKVFKEDSLNSCDSILKGDVVDSADIAGGLAAEKVVADSKLLKKVSEDYSSNISTTSQISSRKQPLEECSHLRNPSSSPTCSSASGGNVQFFNIYDTEAVDDGDETDQVRQWLRKLGLGRYFEQLELQGFDNMKILASLNDDQVKVLMELCPMPLLHEQQLRRGLARLDADVQCEEITPSIA